MSDVVCIGQSMVDIMIDGFVDEFLPERRIKQCDSMTLEIGGDATNESRILKRLGVDVSIVHGRGDDGVGKLLEALFTEDGVDLTHSIVFPGLRSASVIHFVPSDGTQERHSIGIRGTRAHLDFQVTPEMVKGAKVVSLASLFYEPFRDPQKVLAAAKLAKEAGALLCADCNVNRDVRAQDYADAFKYIDYFFPNHEEAREFTHTDTVEQAADFFLGLGVKNIIIKSGADGCYMKNAQGALRVPAIPVAKVIDTTGAGDNFAAGFICSLLEGKDVESCLRFATAAASIAITTIGASTGVRSKQQVLDVLAAGSIS